MDFLANINLQQNTLAQFEESTALSEAMENLSKSVSYEIYESTECAVEEILKKQHEYDIKIEDLIERIPKIPFGQLDDYDASDVDIIKRLLVCHEDCIQIVVQEINNEIPSDPRYDTFEERDRDVSARKCLEEIY